MSQKYDRRAWVKQLFSLHGSVLPQIGPKVLVISLLAWAVAWLENQTHLPKLPITPFTVLGTALGLLLTLRTNASYDRFWEGRKAWGGIVNRTRNFARQAVVVFSDAEKKDLISRLLCSFVYSAKDHLQRDNTSPALVHFLGEERLAALEIAPGVPQRCLLELGRILSTAKYQKQMDSIDQLRMEEDLTYLIDQFGVCQRIQKTPIPVGYVLHLRRFVVLYCLSLTLALVDPLGWYSPLVVGFVSYAFLGIERVGIEIEDPFEKGPNDIDLESICKTIERDVRSILAS